MAPPNLGSSAILCTTDYFLATEQDGADLLKRVLEKVGSYTDVVASVGSFSFTTNLLEQSLDDFRKVRESGKPLCWLNITFTA